MANYSCTNLYVFGPQREVANLFAKLKRWTRKDEQKQPTAFGSGWIGFIAERTGIQPFDGRAGVVRFQYDGRGLLYILYKSAWAPQPQFWEALLRKFAPVCKSYYLAEESCTGLYVTNDRLKRVITVDYAIPARDASDGSYIPSEFRPSTFYTKSGMYELLSSRYGEGKDMDELLKMAWQDDLRIYKVRRVH